MSLLKNTFIIALIYIIFGVNLSFAEQGKDIINFRTKCSDDLEFIRQHIIKNSAPYANDKDTKFKNWFDHGYKNTQDLISGILDIDDCYYALRYYINGFGISHMHLRNYIPLPTEQYPGFLSILTHGKHLVFYKHPTVSYLQDLDIGDEITHINDIKISDYYAEYILPFYANDESVISLSSSSLHTMVIDGNRYSPLPKTIKYIHKNQENTLDLKYTDLTDDALKAATRITKPNNATKFTVEMIEGAVWIKIPSFFLDRSETIYYNGMLSKLKSLAQKEDYIIFDLRGNRGGSSAFARPILRNLWGDDFIKSLGKNHDYNNLWQKNVRVSQGNFSTFKAKHNEEDNLNYQKLLNKKNSFFADKWDIYTENKNLYTNNDSSPVKAKIILLTDNICRSTCWVFVNEMRQMPNVEHVGLPTTIQTIYSNAVRARLPSENFDLFYPTYIRINPSANLGTSLIPNVIYDGNLNSESEIIHWILTEIIK